MAIPTTPSDNDNLKAHENSPPQLWFSCDTVDFHMVIRESFPQTSFFMQG